MSRGVNHTDVQPGKCQRKAPKEERTAHAKASGKAELSTCGMMEEGPGGHLGGPLVEKVRR